LETQQGATFPSRILPRRSVIGNGFSDDFDMSAAQKQADNNGKPRKGFSDDELRAAELAIMEDPNPRPIDGGALRILIDGDCQAREVLERSPCRGGACAEGNLCDNCIATRRYVAVRLHRLDHGRPVHASDRAGYSDSSDQRAPDANGKATPIIVTLADVQARKIEWLWPHWIPRGAVTLFDGDPGLGKSTVAIDLAARVSRGWQMPPAGGPGNGAADVLLLSAEDDLAATIRPRLETAGADLQRVHAFTAIRVGEDEKPPVLPHDLDFIEAFAVDHVVSLIVVDPFMAFLDGNVDAHRDQDVRRALHRMKDLAERTQAAIVLIRHLNKINHSIALYRGGGSIGIVGAARSGILVGVHPDRKEVRVMASTKSNLGPVPRSLTFTLESAGDAARVAWGDEVDLAANDILSAAGANKTTEAERCTAAILDYLAGAAKPSEEVETAMKQAGYSQATFRRAKKAAGIRSHKEGFSGRWMLAPPGEGAQT
jgi:hypothetical protein